VLFEDFRYSPGPKLSTRAHAHELVQICLSPNLAGKYWVRGASHLIPEGSVSVIPPDELHYCEDLEYRKRSSWFPVLYFERDLPSRLANVDVSSLNWKQIVVESRPLLERFLHFHIASRRPLPALKFEAWLISLLRQLFLALGARSMKNDEASEERSARLARKIRELLDREQLTQLRELENLLDRSQFAILRAFKRAFGLSIHQYLLQKRVEQAKRLILDGHSISNSALAAGFCDQSHLTRMFRRFYLTTPARYLQLEKRS
jgi:AraC-like DNA-binding protein